MNRNSTNIIERWYKTILGLALMASSGLLVGCEFGARPPGPDRAVLTSAATSERWQFGDVEGQKLSTPHYAIYTTSGERDLITRLPEFMESTYAHYCRLSGLPPERDAKPMSIYVLANRQQWAAMTEQITGPAAPTYLKIQNGGYSYNGICVLWDLKSDATFGIAAHEGMHQFLHHRMKDALPAWAEEGVCTLFESCRMVKGRSVFKPTDNPIRSNDLHRLFGSSAWIPLEKLLGGDAGDFLGEQSNAYYSQLWALALYIQSEPRYRAGFETMLRLASQDELHTALGLSSQADATRSLVHVIALPAFERYIDRNMRPFERNYREYCRKVSGEVQPKKPWYVNSGR